MQKTCFALFLALAAPLLAGSNLVAPDLNWSDARPTYLGLVNRSDSAISLTLDGYGEDGTHLGTLAIGLTAYERVESATDLLFGDDHLAWAEIRSDKTVVAYVRYQREKAMSIVPLSRISGPDLFLPALTGSGAGSQVVLVNTSAEAGEIFSAPKRAYPHNINAAHLHEPVALTGASAAHSQFRSAYSDLLTGEKAGLLWDRFHSSQSWAGVQHIFPEAGKGLGSLALQLTPPHHSFFAPMQPASNGFKTHIVLVNTTEGRLRAQLTIYDAILPEPSMVELDLAAGEKLDYTLGDPTQLPQYRPLWVRLSTKADGLISYQYTVNSRSEQGAHLNPVLEPAQRLVLPYVVQNGKTTTRVTLINPTERSATYSVRGFDDSGNLIKKWSAPIFVANHCQTYTAAEMFGNRAGNVSWLEVRADAGKVVALALISTSDGATMAAFTPTPAYIGSDQRLITSVEFPTADELGPQTWRGIRFDDEIDRLNFIEKEILDNGYTIPQPGRFFSECHFIASEGKYFLGYEPLCIGEDNTIVEPQEELALISPFFEVPDYTAHYLAFDLRLIDPEASTPGSRYGLVWRVEGSDDWQWFGLTGEILHDPPTRISDCWERVCYRTNEREVTLTPWFEFQTKLPESVAGKRIQVGLFYNHIHRRNSAHFGPNIFIDNVRISATALAHPLFYPEAAGSVTPAETLTEEPVIEAN